MLLINNLKTIRVNNQNIIHYILIIKSYYYINFLLYYLLLYGIINTEETSRNIFTYTIFTSRKLTLFHLKDITGVQNRYMIQH